MDRKAYIIIGIALLLIIGGFLYWYNWGDNGRIFTQEKKQSDETTANDGDINAQKDLIRVSGIQANQMVKSPLKVSGEARGNWYFEASFPVKLLDANGRLLAEAPAQAKGDWMTTNFVPFEVTLTFAKPTTATGVLVLEKDNPSGLAEYADELRIPVKFEVQDQQLSPAAKAARNALASRLGISTSSVIVTSIESREWPNSCLGLERPEEFCAQVIVPGFQVTLKAQGRTYAYRTNVDGSVVAAVD